MTGSRALRSSSDRQAVADAPELAVPGGVAAADVCRGRVRREGRPAGAEAAEQHAEEVRGVSVGELRVPVQDPQDGRHDAVAHVDRAPVGDRAPRLEHRDAPLVPRGHLAEASAERRGGWTRAGGGGVGCSRHGRGNGNWEVSGVPLRTRLLPEAVTGESRTTGGARHRLTVRVWRPRPRRRGRPRAAVTAAALPGVGAAPRQTARRQRARSPLRSAPKPSAAAATPPVPARPTRRRREAGPSRCALAPS